MNTRSHAAGYVVLVPELYWRLDRQGVDESAPDAVEQAMALAGQLDWSAAVGDAVAAFTHLQGMDEVRAVPAVLVSYYGSALPELLDLVPQVTCPSLHAFDNDDFHLHHPEASRQAGGTTLGFLQQHLGSLPNPE